MRMHAAVGVLSAVAIAGATLAACGDPVTQPDVIAVVAHKEITPGARIFVTGMSSRIDINTNATIPIKFSESCYQRPNTPKWFCSAGIANGSKFYAFAGYLDNPGDGDLVSLGTQGARLHVLTVGSINPNGGQPVKMQLTLTP
jgi:hypothetical protein